MQTENHCQLSDKQDAKQQHPFKTIKDSRYCAPSIGIKLTLAKIKQAFHLQALQNNSKRLLMYYLMNPPRLSKETRSSQKILKEGDFEEGCFDAKHSSTRNQNSPSPKGNSRYGKARVQDVLIHQGILYICSLLIIHDMLLMKRVV